MIYNTEQSLKDMTRVLVATTMLSVTPFLTAFMQSVEPQEQKTQTIDVDFHYLDKDSTYLSYQYSYEKLLTEGEEEHKKVMIRTSDYTMGSLYCELPPHATHFDCTTFENQSDDVKKEALEQFVQSDFFQHTNTATIPNIFLTHINNDDIAPKQGKIWDVYTDKSTRYNVNLDSLRTAGFKLERSPKAVPRSKEITNKEIDLGKKTYCLTEQANKDFLDERGYSESNDNPYYNKTCISLDEMGFDAVQELFTIFNNENLENNHADVDTIAVLSVNETAKAPRSYSLTWKK